MEQTTTLTDPYGLRIDIDESLCGKEAEMTKYLGLFSDFRSVIERPVFIIDLSTSTQPTRYYFRSLSRSLKLLVRVEKRSGGWQANHCSKNPSDNFLHSLARQGNLLSPMNEDYAL